MIRVPFLAAGTALALGSLPASLRSQDFDRSQPPRLAPPPSLTLPTARSATLPNGLTLRVVEMHEVPLVQFRLLIAGGGRADGDDAGLATFTANMLDEGAGTRDALAIAAEAEFLGASLGTSANWDYTIVTLRGPKRSMGRALDLMADVVLRPTFAAAEVSRQRDLRLAGILQQRDNPGVVANLLFNDITFPDGHPYHRSLTGDSASTALLDSAMVRGFYARTMLPGRATLLITGDITLAEAQREVEHRFGGWKSSGAAAPAPAAPAAELPQRTGLYLVDKPGAAQSVIVIGHPGVARTHPDYFALEVMNTILGGSFSSRLNTNLRETKGYTYGARSGFQYLPLPGPFTASSSVRTNVTDSSLVEFFKELNDIRDRAVDPDELERAKNYLALGLPGEFETTSQMAGKLSELLTFGLPMSYYEEYVRKILGVTTADVQRVARTYLQPDRSTIVVVGDLTKIRPGIEALRLGPVSVREP